jgi:hypothetical protein
LHEGQGVVAASARPPLPAPIVKLAESRLARVEADGRPLLAGK